MAKRPIHDMDLDQEEVDHGDIPRPRRVSRPPSLPPASAAPSERVTSRHSIPKVVDRMEHADESGGS